MQQVGLRFDEHRGDLGMRAGQHRGDIAELFFNVLAVGLGEHAADDRGDHALGFIWDHGEDIAHHIHPAALPPASWNTVLIAFFRPCGHHT